MNLFVKNTDEFIIEVFAWEDGDGIKATHDKVQVPKESSETDVISFTFRKPNYADTTEFMRQAQFNEKGISDVAGFQDLILRTLLRDWSITENGKKIPVKIATISKLHPNIALAATAGCLEKIF